MSTDNFFINDIHPANSQRVAEFALSRDKQVLVESYIYTTYNRGKKPKRKGKLFFFNVPTEHKPVIIAFHDALVNEWKQSIKTTKENNRLDTV